MYQFLTKNGTSVAFGLGLLIAILFLFSVLGGLDGFNALPKDDKGTTSIFNIGLQAALVLIVLCAIVALLFGIYHLVTNPKGAVKLIIGLAVLVGLIIVLYSISTPEKSGPIFETIQEFNISDNVSKFISAALSTVLILAGLAALSFVVSEIRNLFK